MKTGILFFSLFFVSLKCDAQTYYGFGAAPCNSFLSGNKIAYFSWAQGYISAISVIAKIDFHENGKFPDTDAQLDKLLSYCKKNPLDPFINAVIPLTEKEPELKKGIKK